MKRGIAAAVAVYLLAGLPSFALAQGGVSSSITGTVVDTSGGVLPGADVVATNNATRETLRAVTTSEGTFTIPAVSQGTYTVSVSLMGFKTIILNDVAVNAGVPASVKAVLDVGALAETVTVEAASMMLQTQTAAVSTTLDIKQVTNLPLASRNALEFMASMPGVQTGGSVRDSIVNGLPQSSINITLDGASIQDNFNKSTDGFFARLSPQIDAVEEVTISTASNNVDANGQGAIQVRFATRSGSNDLRGSVYSYFRHDGLNANTWFNNRDLLPDPATGKAPKAELRQYEPGFNVGGPIVIPGIWDGHDKGFFFFNYTQFRSPRKVTRERVLLHPMAEQGMFRYATAGGGVRQVNLMALAAANSQVSSIDPTMAKLLADIRSSTSQGQLADLSDPLLQRLTFQTPAKSLNHFPTGRVDFNLSSKHRLTGSFNYQHIDSAPDLTNNVEPRFPGFGITASQQSTRYTTSNALRSTLNASLVNELRVGATGGATFFSPELKPDLWSSGAGSQGGFHLNINNACCSTPLTNAGVAGGTSSREASTKFVENTVTWLRGGHTFSFGGAFTQADVWLKNQLQVPELRFDAIAGSPAAAMFNAANFPGASTGSLTNARRLYAILIGSVSEVRGISRLNEESQQYEYLGTGTQRGRLREFDIFTGDAWRMRPNLTVNYGLRYMVQLPFYPLNSSYTTGTLDDIFGVSGVGNLFAPGTLTGSRPTFDQYTEGSRGYATDWNNVAPSLGITWSPPRPGGLLGRLVGNDGDTVLRAGYSLGYIRPGMADFTGVYGDNPGVSLNTFRNNTLGNLGALPLLLRDTPRLGPPAFNATPAYPMTEPITEDMEIFDPDLEVPYSQSWSAGVQRSLGKNFAIDVSYIGTRHLKSWIEFDYNEVNISENGFLNEFRLAQGNLQANIAAGRGANFRYFGPGSGTSPLPIYLAYFSGLAAPQAGNAASYTSALFQDTAFVNDLARFYPQPRASADRMDADSTRIANALRAGLPANFLVANPDLLGGAEVFGNGGDNRYHGLQLKLTKRYSNGLAMQANYAFGNAWETGMFSFRKPTKRRINGGEEGSITHALKANFVYDLPMGRGRRFGSNVGGVLDRVIGGWSIGGTARLTSGTMLDFGNVRLVGMSKGELRKEFKLRFDNAGRAVYMLPDDIVDNTFKAWSVSATSPTGYGPEGPPSGRYIAPANGPDCVEIAQGFGDCGLNSVIVTGPSLRRYDFSVVKRVPLAGNVKLEFRAELLNAFNTPWFEATTGNVNGPEGNNLTDFRETPLYNSRDQFRLDNLNGTETSRVIQLISRISW